MPFDDGSASEKYEALRAAGYLFLDELFDAVNEVIATTSHEPLLSWLPGQFSQHYTPFFAKRFLVCAISVTGMIDQWDGESVVASCTAEALVVRALIQTAQSLVALEAEANGRKPTADADALDFSLFEELMLPDTDVEWLFDPAYDGIEDTEIAQSQGMMLRPEDWFTPYIGPGWIHPYCRLS